MSPMSPVSITPGGQDRVAVKRPLRDDKDVCSNPAATRTKLDFGKAPCTEGAPMIQKQDVSGRPAHDR